MTSRNECDIFCVRNGYNSSIQSEWANYYTLSICIKYNKCIDCVNYIIGNIGLSYEAMEKRQFSVWFEAIKKGRYDILCALLEHGCERYSEYTDEEGNDSYTALMITIGDNIVSKNTFTDIFWLFVAAGIPVDESVIECVDRIATSETEDIIAEYCYLNYYFFHKK